MRRRRGGRSSRSYVIEFGLTALAIIAIFLWMNNGGPQAFGDWLAPMFAPRR